MSDLIIRQAGPADADAIAAVHVASWQAAYRGLLPQDYLDGLDPADRAPRWRQTLEQARWPRGGVLVASRQGKVVGFSGARPSPDDDADPATGQIYTLYLLESAWGSGTGRALMAAITAELRAGYREATLWVLDTNERARRFYQRAGWTPDGAAKEDERLGIPISEVRYRRALPPA